MKSNRVETRCAPRLSHRSGERPAWIAILLVTAWALAASVATLQASEEPLTPAECAARPGETCTVQFKVETVARVTDITDRDNHKPLEVQLVDVPSGEEDPTERASIIVCIPEAVRSRFGAGDLDELARKFEGKTVRVTGTVEVEPHPVRHDAEGKKQPRPRITVTDPRQIRFQA